MNEKQKYLQVLVEVMRSAGTGNWSYNDMADLCELAGMRHEWMVKNCRRRACCGA